MKTLLTFVLLLFSGISAYAQYSTGADYAELEDYKTAQKRLDISVVSLGVSSAAFITGGLIKNRARNDYVNSHAAEWTEAEIQLLEEDAKETHKFKVGNAFFIPGLIGSTISILWMINESQKMWEIRNSSGNMVAMLSCGSTRNGIGICVYW